MPRRSSGVAAVHAGPMTGSSAKMALTVGDGDTAIAWRSGSVPVLATPRLIALCEEASVGALGGQLAPGTTSVATRVQFDHLAPVAVGETVTAEATLEKVEGRRLTFTVTASLRSTQRACLVGAGRVTRVVVDEAAFLAKAGTSAH